jgi:hypothetical protein
MTLPVRFINHETQLQSTVEQAGIYFRVQVDDLESGLSLPWQLYHTLNEAVNVARQAVAE